MVNLPILRTLKVENYGLFPGTPNGDGITWLFKPGVSLIAGINGLGKTTLLNMVLRSFTGPYDLTSSGSPQTLTVVLPKKPVRLTSRSTGYFRQRVADSAENAEVTLSANFGKSHLEISRRLNDLFLKGCSIDEISIDLPTDKEDREVHFQSLLMELMGLGSFIDVLLVLHHVILFHENRPGALWDPNAQRQLLRALCLNKDDASKITELEREVQSADSQARNIHTRITDTKKDLRETQKLEAGAKGVKAELEVQQRLLDAELEEASRLEALIGELDEQRQDARLEYERAKIERENAVGSIERLKYAALLQHFPRMDDTTRLVISRIMTDDHCLVCNANVKEKRIELERQIALGCCPICGSEPSTQDNITALHEFKQAKLDRAREQAKKAKSEEVTKSEQLRGFIREYDLALEKLSQIRKSIRAREDEDSRLRLKLPQDLTSDDYERTLNTLNKQFLEKMAARDESMQELRSLLDSKRGVITEKSEELMDTFEELTGKLLVEEVRLVQVDSKPRYLQAKVSIRDRFNVPAYAAEMKAADRPGFVRRKGPTDVSESQRELVDLAFRLALVKVFAGGNASTFVMETPEASLDGLAMERVGNALANFADENENRLVVTSNLSNAGIITALFGGPASSKQESEDRLRNNVLNLLQIAVPNRALLQDSDRYNSILHRAISGNSQ